MYAVLVNIQCLMTNCRYSTINFKKLILPKLSHLLTNAFNNNAQAVCPNILPFFSKLTPQNLQDIPIYEFYIQFFTNLKSAICSDKVVSKADASSIIKTYFECYRYLMQKLKNSSELKSEDEDLIEILLKTHLLELISSFLNSDSNWAKIIFLQTSALIAFWSDRQNESEPKCLYVRLLNEFWKNIFDMIGSNVNSRKQLNPKFLEHLNQLVYDLYVATPSLEDQKVKFQVSHDNEEVTTKNSVIAMFDQNGDGNSLSLNKCKSNTTSAVFIHKELRELVIKLVRLCLDNLRDPAYSSYIHHVRRLTKLFSSPEFYAELSSDKSGIDNTLNEFIDLMDILYGDDCEVLIDIAFEVLQEVDKDKRFEFISQMIKVNMFLLL